MGNIKNMVDNLDLLVEITQYRAANENKPFGEILNQELMKIEEEDKKAKELCKASKAKQFIKKSKIV